MPSGNKSLPESVVTKISLTISMTMASLGHKEWINKGLFTHENIYAHPQYWLYRWTGCYTCTFNTRISLNSKWSQAWVCLLKAVGRHDWVSAYFDRKHRKHPDADFIPDKILNHWCDYLTEAEWRIYASVNNTIIGSDNGLAPTRQQAIVWSNTRILIIEPLWTDFSEILIRSHTFSFKQMCLKMFSEKRRPFCLSLNVLISHTCKSSSKLLNSFLDNK